MITIDNTTKGGGSGGSPVSFNHTNAGNLLVIGIVTGGGIGDVVTGATYDGVAMIRINTITISTVSRIYFYYLLAPNVGTLSVSVSFTGANAPTVAVASFIGAKQSGQPDASTTSQDTGSTSNTLTTDTNKCIHVCFFETSGGGTLTLGGDTQALITSIANAFDGLYWNIADIPTGSHTLSFSQGSNSLATVGAAFAPASVFIPEITLI